MLQGKRGDCGQATLEAAFLLPFVLFILLMLLQPAILLYTESVMNSAASETCRLLRTRPAVSGEDQAYVGYATRRLSAVPPVDMFHMHAPCSWSIELDGNELSDTVSVSITNRIRPLPLIGGVWTSKSKLDSDGCLVQRVTVSAAGRPTWVDPSMPDPSDWVSR